jgi:hypothetical protein
VDTGSRPELYFTIPLSELPNDVTVLFAGPIYSGPPLAATWMIFELVIFSALFLYRVRFAFPRALHFLAHGQKTSRTN